MASLTLNGIEIQIAEATRTTARFGGFARAFSGKARKAERARKREWRCKTLPLTVAEAVAVQGLVEGYGQHWSFDSDAYADSGLGLSSGALTAIASSGGLVNHGTFGYCSGYTARAQWTVGPNPQWTLLASLFRVTSTWKRFVVRSDGSQYYGTVSPPTLDNTLDRRTLTYDPTGGIVTLQSVAYGGSARANSTARTLGSLAIVGSFTYEVTVAGTTAASPPAFTSTIGATTVDGTVTWKNIGETAGSAGDLVFLPFLIPDAWVSPAFAFHLANPWSTLPALVAGGDMIGTATTTVMGEVTNSESVSFQGAAGWVGTGEVVEFTLYEV